MKIDKSLMAGSTTMLVLKLLDSRDMYGYQMIKELKLRSENVFNLKAGTLYPILHTLEQQTMVEYYEQLSENGRLRKYYRITTKGRKLLQEKKSEWNKYTSTVNDILGGISCVMA